MKHYYFCETVTDKEFLVGAYSYEEARKIAEEVAQDISEVWHIYAWDLEYYGTMSEIEAECSELDEY